MSNPSFSNIDLWLFELNEGNLSSAQAQQLETFLLLHPELEVDKDVWESVKLQSQPVVFSKKDSLKKDSPIFWIMDYVSLTLVIIGMIALGIRSPFELSPSDQSMKSVYGDEKASLLLIEESNVKNKSNKVQQVVENRVVNYYKAVNAINTSSETELNVAEDKAFLFQKVQALKVKEAKVIPSSFDGNTKKSNPISLSAMNDELHEGTNKSIISSNYQKSWKSKLSKFSRQLQNMMDNPVALKNFRDPHFSIPGLSVSDVNFSSTGTQLATCVSTLSRLQWYGQENQSLSNQLNIDGYVYGIRGGLGIQINHDMYKNGGVNIADVALTYSPKISISNTVSLEPSVRFKMGNKLLNHAKMNDVSAIELERGIKQDYFIDGTTPTGNNLWYKDLGVGLIVNTKWFFVGAQVDNIFRHRDNIFNNENSGRAAVHFIGSVGTDWVSRKGNIRLSPYAVYQNKGQLSELWAGMNFSWNWFVVGGSFSTGKDPSASVGMKFNQFSMYYSADYSKSKLTSKRAVSHQVSLKFVGKQSQFGKRLLKL